MAKPKTRKKTIRREAFEGVEPLDALDEERPNLGRLIENGLLMLVPLIVERIVASATSPARHEPVPPAADLIRHVAFREGRDDVLVYVPRPERGCSCEACKLLDMYADKLGRQRVQ